MSPKFTKKIEHKYVRLRRTLLEIIRKSAPGTQLPSYNQMSLEMDVTQPTIDRVLQELTIAGLVERRQGKGIFVSNTSHDKAVALVFGGQILSPWASPFYNLLLINLQAYGREKNLKTRYYIDTPDIMNPLNENASHKSYEADAASGRISGVIVGSLPGLTQLEWLRQAGAPVVWFTGNIPIPGAVVLDFMQLIRVGVDSLASRGCKKIGLISPFFYPADEQGEFALEIINTFQKSLAAHHLPFVEDFVVNPDFSTDRAVRQGVPGSNNTAHLISRRLAGHEFPDGLIITDDICSRSVINKFQSAGIRLNHDVKIASHSNQGSPSLHEMEDQLIRLEVDVYELARCLYEQLQRAQSQPDLPPPHFMPIKACIPEVLRG
ncbi:MAG: GntR family transcriptional regulator [Verrucomicrobiae bacterium]|nr:GntR family transcriptional regulator [Verrucomicrobiae bacterium]